MRACWLVVLAGCTPHHHPADRKPGPAVTEQTVSLMPERIEPPATPRDSVVEVIHGREVSDPYRWLELAGAPKVVDWMKVQDAHARTRLEAMPGRERLRERLQGLLYYDTVSPPRRRGERLFYTRKHANKEKAIYYVRPADSGAERVLLDPNAMSTDGSVSIHGVFPSRDGRFVAYKLSRNNSDHAMLHVLDLDGDGERTQERIGGARYAQPSWTPDSTGFYYTALPTDPAIPPSELPGYAEIRFHELGSDPGTDALVHPALGDPTTFLGSEVAFDGRYLLVSVSRGFDSTDVYFGDLRDGPVPRLVPLAVGTGYRASVIAFEGRFIVHTNDGAPRFRVMVVDPARPERSAWRELVAQSNATLEDISVVGGQLQLSYLDKASSRLELRTLDGQRVRTVDLPGIGTVQGVVGEPDQDEAFFYFSSFTQVPQIHAISVASGKRRLWHEVDFPVDTSGFAVDQVWYPSRDGTPISMFVVHRRDVQLDGNNPTLLTGYGGFSVSMTPVFSVGAVLWLEHGGVWAVPNLRGGGEYGESWHEAGKLHNKQNVFDDFIYAARWLIDQGYTRPAKLAIRGGSNGGLLVGAASTQRPDLFGAIVCAVPLLDMIRYHLFGSGKTWASEYGSAADAEQFATLMAYSPYHHVEAGVRYPPMLMLAADSDDRVDPMHARKYVAALQHAAPDVPALLRIEKNAGHGGADLVRQAVDQAVDVYAFLFAELGVTAMPARSEP